MRQLDEVGVMHSMNELRLAVNELQARVIELERRVV
jgi:hypothetical protein